jgi:hypothetical protein
MDVGSLRAYVRNQLEMDDEEMPDVLLNVYFQDAFDRTMAFDNHWPRMETIWDVAKVPGEYKLALPADLNIPSIVAVISVTNGYTLAVINQENAEQAFFTGNSTPIEGTPVYCSIWDRTMTLWPSPALASTYDVQIRGYRQPVWSNSSSAIPDLDERLHICLAYYAISLCYAQQEDEVLEGVYLGRWQRDLTQQLRTIMEPVRSRPLVMNGGGPIGGTPTFRINPPVGL